MNLRPLVTAALLTGLPAIPAQAQAGDDDGRHSPRLIEFDVPGAATAVRVLHR
ncbi:MAG: hypothetical protein ACRETP_08660 [Steroidobacteraceae bacterium]